MKLIYVAGPFRAKNSWDMEQNIRAAETVALEVWRAGYACICPHANTRFYQGAAEDEVWLKGDLEILKRCDAILVLPNWMSSSGTKGEIEFAGKNDIPVYFSLEELVENE